MCSPIDLANCLFTPNPDLSSIHDMHLAKNDDIHQFVKNCMFFKFRGRGSIIGCQ